MAKKKTQKELVMARVATVVAVVLCGVFLGWQFSKKAVDEQQSEAAILESMPRFSRYVAARTDGNNAIQVIADVQGQRYGNYQLLLEVVNFRDEAIYGDYQIADITAYPYTFHKVITSEELKTVIKDRYGLKDERFCEPVNIRLTLTALGSDVPYTETIRWRANVDVCTFGDTFIPPQANPPPEPTGTLEP